MYSNGQKCYLLLTRSFEGTVLLQFRQRKHILFSLILLATLNILKKMSKDKPDIIPLGDRPKMLNELKRKYPYYNFKSNLLAVLFVAGIILTIWWIYIYNVILIPAYIPFFIWLFTGLIMTPVFKKAFNIYCFNPFTPGQTPIIIHCLYNIISFGGILVFLLMWTNQNFTDHSKRIIRAKISSYKYSNSEQLYGSKGPVNSRGGCEMPYVTINYMNIKRQFTFPCGTEVEKYESVNLEVERGFFGFYVIYDKTLVKRQW